MAIKANSKRKSTRQPSQAQSRQDGARSADMPHVPPLIDMFKLLIEPGAALSNFQALALRQWFAPWIMADLKTGDAAVAASEAWPITLWSKT